MSGTEIKIKDSVVTNSEDYAPYNWKDGREAEEQIQYIQDVKEYVIITECTDGSFHKVSPIQVKREIKKEIVRHKEIETFRFTRNNKFLITTKSHECAQEIITKKNIFERQVKHNFLNENITTRFLLFKVDLDITPMEIKEELEEENNVCCQNIKRFVKRQDGNLVPTGTVLITIYGHELPEYVKFFYMRQKLRLFIDRPRRCNVCQSYTHATNKCVNEKKCKRCGKNHPEVMCNEIEIRCANCGKEHEADHVDCESRKKEMEILALKSEKHITLAEARRQASVRETKSYAAKVKQQAVQESTDNNYHRLAILVEDKFQKIMEIFIQLCEVIGNTHQQIEDRNVKETEDSGEGDETEKKKSEKRDLMAEFFGRLSGKKLKLSNQGQNSQLFQSMGLPDSEDMQTDSREG